MEKTCSNCGDPLGRQGARGYCGKCYQRWRKYGDASDSVLQRHSRKGSMCTNCGEPVDSSGARGYCGTCYMRWWTHGDPSIVLPPSPPPINRKYTLNHEYFDDICTPEQAYWLGFITADGCVHKDARNYAVSLSLAGKDAEHVRLFVQALGSDAPVRNDTRGQAYATLNSRYLVESLERIGVGPRKSATAEPWNGPVGLMPHYWRGLFDGDGCICRSGGELYVTIVGSAYCVEAFAAWGRTVCGSRAKVRPTSSCPTCWQWAVGGRHMATRLVRELYEGAPVALRRKQQIADEILTG